MKPPPHDPMPTVMRAARRARGMTQQQLAEAAGVSVRTVVGIELGEVAHPRPGNLAASRRVLDLDVSETAPPPPRRRTTEVALFMLGSYLDSLPEDEAMEVVSVISRQVFPRPDVNTPRQED